MGTDRHNKWGVDNEDFIKRGCPKEEHTTEFGSLKGVLGEPVSFELVGTVWFWTIVSTDR